MQKEKKVTFPIDPEHGAIDVIIEGGEPNVEDWTGILLFVQGRVKIGQSKI